MDQASVHEWLKDTPIPGLGCTALIPTDAHHPAASPPRTNNPLAAERFWNLENQRHSDAQKQAEAAKPLRDGRSYERRPRRATKVDRYEYKTSTRHRDRRKEARKNKILKQNRKHTLNENFHAPNVPHGRLSLNTRTHMGLFRKGRTSSPVKPREIPDLAFSEMNFLSKRSAQNAEATYDRRGNGNGAVREENNFQMQIPQYFSNDNPERPASGDTGQREIETARSFDQQPILGNQHEDYGQDHTRSATPYTWSESNYAPRDLQSSSEDCTKGILCVNPRHEHLNEEERAVKKYWDLGDLKRLQKIRVDRRVNHEDRAVRDEANSSRPYPTSFPDTSSQFGKTVTSTYNGNPIPIAKNTGPHVHASSLSTIADANSSSVHSPIAPSQQGSQGNNTRIHVPAYMEGLLDLAGLGAHVDTQKLDDMDLEAEEEELAFYLSGETAHDDNDVLGKGVCKVQHDPSQTSRPDFFQLFPSLPRRQRPHEHPSVDLDDYFLALNTVIFQDQKRSPAVDVHGVQPITSTCDTRSNNPSGFTWTPNRLY